MYPVHLLLPDKALKIPKQLLTERENMENSLISKEMIEAPILPRDRWEDRFIKEKLNKTTHNMSVS